MDNIPVPAKVSEAAEGDDESPDGFNPASDVVRLVVSDGLRLAGVGVVIGVAAALWAGKWVKPLLFNVSPKDPWVFVIVATTLVAVALAASWIPAMRASRVDANVALRTE